MGCAESTGADVAHAEIAVASPAARARQAGWPGKTRAGPADSAQSGSSRASTTAERAPPELAPLSPSAITPCPTSSASACSVAPTASQTSGRRVALGRYAFDGGRAPLGEGATSVCYEGTDVATGQRVAVKVYKAAARAGGSGDGGVAEMFRRQVAVLRELQLPLARPADDRLWSPELARSRPSDLFVQLLDHSRDASGAPGPDPADGSMYVVSELAERTLQGLLARHHEESRPLPEEQVLKIAREVTLAVAGLHAKGLVHMDVKPENIMLCGGRWKLIDMDGCLRAGTVVRSGESTVSFSPCYCSPEFARFVVEGDSIVATPALDVWSVGVTLAELVELCPVFRARYVRLAKGRSQWEASARFMDWLGRQREAPRLSGQSSACFLELIQKSLAVPKSANRKTLAASLSCPFYQDPGSRDACQKHA